MNLEAQRDNGQAPDLADCTSARTWAASVDCLQSADVPRSLFEQVTDTMKSQPIEAMLQDLVQARVDCP
jgi:hypothetical protein